MLDGLLSWLAALPPVATYGVLGLLASVENFFPPFPADTAIALGAFLAHRGVTNPWAVFAVTVVGSVGGAMVMYALAERHATSLLRSRVGQVVLSEDAIERLRAGYLRYGIAVIFFGRILPGFRAVVGPFAGLMHLGFFRTIIPMTLGSALWYGTLVFLAVQLGNRLGDILTLLSNVNRTLGIVSLVVVVVVATLVFRRIRRRRALQGAAREEEEQGR